MKRSWPLRELNVFNASRSPCCTSGGGSSWDMEVGRYREPGKATGAWSGIRRLWVTRLPLSPPGMGAGFLRVEPPC